MTDLFLCATLHRGGCDYDVVIYFRCTNYRPGTRHTHPGGHWNRHIGTWDPPDDPEAEFEFLRAEFDGGEPDDAPGAITPAETDTLRARFEAHEADALQAYMDQHADAWLDRADYEYERRRDELMERVR